MWSLWVKGGRSILASAAQRTSLPVTAGQVSAGGEAAAMQRERERECERGAGVRMVIVGGRMRKRALSMAAKRVSKRAAQPKGVHLQ